AASKRRRISPVAPGTAVASGLMIDRVRSMAMSLSPYSPDLRSASPRCASADFVGLLARRKGAELSGIASARKWPLDAQRDLAEVLARLHRAMRLAGLCERQHAVDHGRERALLERRPELRAERRDQRGLLL